MDTTFIMDGSGSEDNVAISNWTWSLMVDGIEIELYGERVEFLMIHPGIYNVSLTVLDERGNTGSDSFFLTIVDTEPPCVNLSEVISTIQFDNFTLSGTECSDNVEIVNYTWILEGISEQVIGYGPILEYNLSTPGNHTIRLIVKDSQGNDASDTITITVEEKKKEEEIPEEDKDDDTSPIGLIILIISAVVVLLIIFIIIFILIRKKKDDSGVEKNEEEEGNDEKDTSSSGSKEEQPKDQDPRIKPIPQQILNAGSPGVQIPGQQTSPAVNAQVQQQVSEKVQQGPTQTPSPEPSSDPKP
jgi:PKD repeat protein